MSLRTLTPYRSTCIAVALLGLFAMHHRLGELHQEHQLAQAVQADQQQAREVADVR